ncbi:MAG: hypothetical protein LC677_15750 [Halomonas sp.]|nr:hypothetical protein [Halomonas sp.]
MSQVIRVPDKLYKRLAVYAGGFETPTNVIEKILEFYERAHPIVDGGERDVPIQEMQPANTLEILYFSDSEGISEEGFKDQLLDTKKAYIRMYYTNDTSEIKEWNASRFGASSSVDGNLRSGYLRGWKDRGIFKAELAINRAEIE